ncbi:unnamed protein product [Protopolystoma xenopodis]|uniref:Uncharacterized protein n=1 Tax=Protopolystoma xenopodis TaxID=117903 RepID=A0A448WP91_9PLAT|nr:unnamed protein product [Protopolystoma xenopodis]
MFLRHEGYLGVVGAYLSGLDLESNGSAPGCWTENYAASSTSPQLSTSLRHVVSLPSSIATGFSSPVSASQPTRLSGQIDLCASQTPIDPTLLAIKTEHSTNLNSHSLPSLSQVEKSLSKSPEPVAVHTALPKPMYDDGVTSVAWEGGSDNRPLLKVDICSLTDLPSASVAADLPSTEAEEQLSVGIVEWMHFGLDHVEGTRREPLPLLLHPAIYLPDTWDFTQDEEARLYWLQCLEVSAALSL